MELGSLIFPVTSTVSRAHQTGAERTFPSVSMPMSPICQPPGIPTGRSEYERRAQPVGKRTRAEGNHRGSPLRRKCRRVVREIRSTEDSHVVSGSGEGT